MLMIVAAILRPGGGDRYLAGIDRGGFVKSQMLECATSDMDRADAALNARYRVVMRRLPPRRAAQLRIEERRWIVDRRARCQVVRQAAIPSPEINRMRCLVRETEARTAYLGTLR